MKRSLKCLPCLADPFASAMRGRRDDRTVCGAALRRFANPTRGQDKRPGGFGRQAFSAKGNLALLPMSAHRHRM